MDWRTRAGKRTLDVVGASVGLALTAPVFPLLALAIKLSSRGPVFYRQTRCGVERRSEVDPSSPVPVERRKTRGYNTFRMTKFRTMKVNAEAATGAVLAQARDPRLTPVGDFLRRSRLDELPQLWHVLIGDMSLVGPRPERPEIQAEIEASLPFFQERMRSVKPGLTGLAQIRLGYDGSFLANRDTDALRAFVGEIDLARRPGEATLPGGASVQVFSNKLLFDLAYSAILENPLEAMKTDLEVLWKTPWVMLKGLGRLGVDLFDARVVLRIFGVLGVLRRLGRRLCGRIINHRFGDPLLHGEGELHRQLAGHGLGFEVKPEHEVGQAGFGGGHFALAVVDLDVAEAALPVLHLNHHADQDEPGFSLIAEHALVGRAVDLTLRLAHDGRRQAFRAGFGFGRK